MKKLALIIGCMAVLSAPLAASSHFSFSFLFNAASLFMPPCPPPIVERHVYMAPCPPPPMPYYQERTLVIQEYRNPCVYQGPTYYHHCRPCYPCCP
jgi:hypothetical protein